MTLDTAIDLYRANPSARTAMRFAQTAKQYFVDGMIFPDTAAKYAVELERAGFKLAMLELMK